MLYSALSTTLYYANGMLSALPVIKLLKLHTKFWANKVQKTGVLCLPVHPSRCLLLHAIPELTLEESVEQLDDPESWEIIQNV